MLSTYSPTSEAGGKVVAPATKGGRRQAVYKMAPQGAHLPNRSADEKEGLLLGRLEANFD